MIKFLIVLIAIFALFNVVSAFANFYYYIDEGDSINLLIGTLNTVIASYCMYVIQMGRNLL